LSFSLWEYLQKNSNKFLLPLAGLFLFILPIPHTLTIRESSLFISVVILLLLFRGRGSAVLETAASLRIQTALYVIFVAWLLIVALFISEDTIWALKEMKTQWVMGSLALILGAGMATLAGKGAIKMRAVMTVIFWTLALHVLAINVDGIFRILNESVSNGSSHGLTALTAGVGGLTIGPIDGSLLVSLFFVFILSEAIFRTVYKKRSLSVSNAVLVISFILIAGSSFLTGMRNIVEMPVVIASAISILIIAGGQARKKALYSCLIFVPLFLAVFTMAYKSDSRWAELKESLDLVMQQEEPAKILAFAPDFVYPTLPDNRPVNISNFIRLTKYRVGVNIIRAYPFGIGFGRNAFGHYLKGRYNSGVGLNSDSSVLDMAVGAGILGLGLFGAFIFSILAMSLRVFKKNGDFYALLLSLLVICFSARMVFDSVLRDHLLEIFMFITGLLSTRVSLIGAGPALSLQINKYRYDDVTEHSHRMKAV